MKKLFVLALLTSGLAFAQVETAKETATESATEPAEGTIAKPTVKQKKTVNNAAKKAEAAEKVAPANSGKVLEDSEVETLPDPHTEVKQDEPVKHKVKKEADIDNVVVKKSSDSSEGHLFGFHGDINIPHILNYGLDYWHSSKYFSVAINGGGYSVNNVAKSTDLPNGANIKITNQEAVIRYHPFAGAFYLGAGFGKHEVTLDANRTVSITTPIAGSADVAISDKVKANYLLPHIGWLWKTSFGLTFGMDLGYLSPSGSSVDLTTQISNISNGAITPADVEATTEYKNARQEVIDNSEKFGKMGLPYWTVLRIGYLF